MFGALEEGCETDRRGNPEKVREKREKRSTEPVAISPKGSGVGAVFSPP
jgi:hypothetical protein